MLQVGNSLIAPLDLVLEVPPHQLLLLLEPHILRQSSWCSNTLVVVAAVLVKLKAIVDATLLTSSTNSLAILCRGG